jgi:O-antigen ligase
MSTITTAVEDTENADISAQSRLALIDAQWRMAAEYPLGAGHRGTAVLSPQYLEAQYLAAPDNPGEIAQRSSHNTFMTALVEQGIPGAILFLLTWAWAARASLFVKRTIVGEPPSTHAWAAAITAILLIVLVGGMFVDYIKSEVQVWMLALLASMVTYARQLSAKSAFAGIEDSGELPAKVAGRVTGPSRSLRLRPQK